VTETPVSITAEQSEMTPVFSIRLPDVVAWTFRLVRPDRTPRTRPDSPARGARQPVEFGGGAAGVPVGVAVGGRTDGATGRAPVICYHTTAHHRALRRVPPRVAGTPAAFQALTQR
jgi:hypothetical protein